MIPGMEGEEDSCYALYGHYSDPKYQATSWREAEAACAYEVLYCTFTFFIWLHKLLSRQCTVARVYLGWPCEKNPFKTNQQDGTVKGQ
jgi:hypothetical protein